MGGDREASEVEANREVLREHIRKAGYLGSRDFAYRQPLVAIEDFFASGVNDKAIVGGTVVSFGITAFARLLIAIRERPDVSDVLIEIDDDFENGWPCHDYIFIATACAAPEVVAWFGEAAPDRILPVHTTHGWVKARTIRIDEITIAAGHHVWALQWDSDRGSEDMDLRYEDALIGLLHTMNRAELAPVVRRYSPGILDAVGEIFDPELLDVIREAGYPGGATIPWPTDALVIGDLAEGRQLQAGYRFNAINGAISTDWPEHLYVIADAGADPFCIDSRTGEILFACHGMGKWDFEKIADDLPQFFNLIERWVSFCVIEKAGNIMNEDSEVEAETLGDIYAKVLFDLDDGTKAAFIRALGI